MAHKTAPRLFTPSEATRTLPLVRRIVDDILEKGRQLRDLVVLPEAPTDAQRELVATLTEELRACMAELESIGCYYKSLGYEEGLVDFPGSIDGELVWLCWKNDEDSLRWYHGFEDGFSGRKRIPERLLSPTA